MKKSVIFIMIVCALAVGLFLYFGREAEEEISYSVNDTLPDGGGRKATVILLGGQSNASGCSRDDYLKQNVSEDKYSEYESGYDNIYINYFATGTNRSDEFVKCAARQGEAGGFFGPELGMAERLNELYPDELFFIIKWAWGGSDLNTNWRPKSSFGKTGSMYNHFVQYVETSIEYLVSKNYDIKIEGMCWMQGESDSVYTISTMFYEYNLKNFISDVRCEFGDYADDDGMAFIDAYIADDIIFWVHADRVNNAKYSVSQTSPMNAVVETTGNGLTCTEEPIDSPDLAHFDSISQIELGHLFADSLSSFMN